MSEPFNLILLETTAKGVFYNGIKSKETVEELLFALENPQETLKQGEANPGDYTTVRLAPEIAKWWRQTLETLPDVVDQVLAAHLRGPFALAIGAIPDIDNNWTLTK